MCDINTLQERSLMLHIEYIDFVTLHCEFSLQSFSDQFCLLLSMQIVFPVLESSHQVLFWSFSVYLCETLMICTHQIWNQMKLCADLLRTCRGTTRILWSFSLRRGTGVSCFGSDALSIMLSFDAKWQPKFQGTKQGWSAEGLHSGQFLVFFFLCVEEVVLVGRKRMGIKTDKICVTVLHNRGMCLHTLEYEEGQFFYVPHFILEVGRH